MTGFDADVAVIGLGAWGAHALWRLAARGVDTIGFDAQAVPNQYGSSHGHTRLFRVACHEHVGLTPVARLARDLWYELGENTGKDLLHQVGLLSVGPEDGRAIATTRRAAAQAGIPVTELSVDEVRERYPQHVGLGDHYLGLIDPEAGFVRVEESISAAVAEARRLGARIHEHTAVSDVVANGSGVVVTTANGRFTARQAVLSTGPWMSVMQDTVKLTAYRAPMLWWRSSSDPDAFSLDRFPPFIRHYDDEHTMWGHGAVDGLPVKLALSHDPRSRIATDPDDLYRGIVPAQDWSSASEIVSWAVPGLDPLPAQAAPCMITESPDGQFVIGRSPSNPSIILAGGCSGHGFKHAAALGELLAQIAVGEEPSADIEFMSPSRFAA